MDRYRAVAGRGRRRDAVHGLSVGLTACGQRARSSHVPDAGAGALRYLTALGSTRLTWWMSAAASSDSRVSDRLVLLQTGVRRQRGTHGDVPLGLRGERRT